MWHIIIIIFLSFLVSFQSFAQVHSTCEAPDSIKNKYDLDAHRIALRWFIDKDLPEADSIRINSEYSQYYLNRLLAIYNADYPAVHDTIFDSLDIRSFRDPVLESFSLWEDSTLPWMQNLKTATIPCGNKILDSFINEYHLKWESYEPYHFFSDLAIVRFSSDSILNMKALCKEINSSFGLFYSGARENFICCKHSDINAVVRSDATYFRFTYGWEYCQSGCSYWRHWEFRVFDDCSVEYLGSYGNPLTTGTKELSEILDIFPNPTKDYLNIENMQAVSHYEMVNSFGQIVQHGTLNRGNNRISISQLVAGVYILRIQSSSHFTRCKIIIK